MVYPKSVQRGFISCKSKCIRVLKRDAMGVLKKLGSIFIVYVLVGIVWSALIQVGLIPPAGGLGGALNVLYIIFMPVSLLYFMIMGSLGLL